jgi:DNA-binding transcriptional LysR family regulator
VPLIATGKPDRSPAGEIWIHSARFCIIAGVPIDEVKVFVSVLEAGSFAAAARRLAMPATTVSAKVAALEQRLGVTLIQRTTRKLRATPVGQRYYDRCRIGLRELESAEAEVSMDTDVPAGRLSLTTPVSLARVLLPPIVVGFRQAFPEVKVDILVTDREADLVGEGIDLAVRVGELKDSSFVARLFVYGSGGFFASASYLGRHGTPKHMDELARHEIIGRGGARAGREARRAQVTLNSLGTITCDDFNLARALIAAGGGIGYLPTLLAHGGADDPPLVRVLPEYSVPQTGLYFVYPSQRFVPARVKAFIAFALDVVKRGKGAETARQVPS